MKRLMRKLLLSLCIILLLGLFTTIIVILSIPDYKPLTFPDGKKFAFTICDDTDLSTVQNIKPVYDLLNEIGMRTTKTVWTYPTNDSTNWANRGQTLSDSLYRVFIIGLRDKGFEIASHGLRGGDSRRSEILEGMDIFKDIIGYYPRIHINHSLNSDNLYWGSEKLEFAPLKLLYDLTSDVKDFTGHMPKSDYFWGDFVRDNIPYVVNFSFHEINITKVNPLMPYHDPDKPFVNYWFHTSDGRDVSALNKLLSTENLDRLENEGGVCIVYTHLAYGFANNGSCDSVFTARITDLASRDGWFVPASKILDYLRKNGQGGGDIGYFQRIYLEFRWLFEKMIYGST
ncbi:MAG: hypothetical protein U9R21_08650 [Candidatus Thermoplasmatota archaeon]|nr:hypothetical protein [Candidatus Thermoplasmatota archaeon]